MLGLPHIVGVGRLALETVDVESHWLQIGGADGIRTHDLLDAITDPDKNGGEQK